MSNYGIPYMGSKSKIIKDIIGIFPKADNFYDLFGGGFSVTHAMLLHRKNDYKNFHFNEIRKGVPELIKNAISGKYNYNVYKPEWIDRERFFKDIDINPVIKLLWSFGNNGKRYLFSKEIEPYKKSMHMAIIFNQFDELAKNVFGFNKFPEHLSVTEKRLHLRYRIEYYRVNGLPEFLHKFLNEKQLERLEQLERLHFYNGDYKLVPIKENSIIYCDIPYQGTSDYDNNASFNHKEFFDWAYSLNHPVFISEFKVKDPRFKEIWSKKVRSLMGGASTKDTPTERIYCNKIAYRMMQLEQMKKPRKV